MSPAELENIRTAIKPVIEKSAGTIGADFVATVNAEIQKRRAAR
jgi:hypothetical protein